MVPWNSTPGLTWKIPERKKKLSIFGVAKMLEYELGTCREILPENEGNAKKAEP